MSSSKDGAMVVLSSPSGAGKTTLVKKISKLNNFECEKKSLGATNNFSLFEFRIPQAAVLFWI